MQHSFLLYGDNLNLFWLSKSWIKISINFSFTLFFRCRIIHNRLKQLTLSKIFEQLDDWAKP